MPCFLTTTQTKSLLGDIKSQVSASVSLSRRLRNYRSALCLRYLSQQPPQRDKALWANTKARFFEKLRSTRLCELGNFVVDLVVGIDSPFISGAVEQIEPRHTDKATCDKKTDKKRHPDGWRFQLGSQMLTFSGRRRCKLLSHQSRGCCNVCRGC